MESAAPLPVEENPVSAKENVQYVEARLKAKDLIPIFRANIVKLQNKYWELQPKLEEEGWEAVKPQALKIAHDVAVFEATILELEELANRRIHRARNKYSRNNLKKGKVPGAR